MFYEAVSVNVARRPYFNESEGALLLQTDPALDGTTMDVMVLLTAANKTWRFHRVPAVGTNASLLPLPFAPGVPQALNNDLLVSVTVHSGDNSNNSLPWVSTTTLTLYTRLIRAPPPIDLTSPSCFA